MGAPMAASLARAGHEMRVWNRTHAKAEGLGATVAETPAHAVEGVEAIITMLADGDSVAAVMARALPASPRAAIWVQMSTVGVEAWDALASLAAEHGVTIVDAPVMGSRPQAEAGQLLPLVSGPEPACRLIAPVLEAFSRDILWLGEAGGLGTRLKLVANHWIINSVENLAETLAFADALTIDPRRFLELISGAPFDMQYAHWKAAMMLEGDFPPAFSLRLARKDVLLALDAAATAGIDLALAQATDNRLARAIELGHGEDDAAATYVAARPRLRKGGTRRRPRAGVPAVRASHQLELDD